MNAQGLIFSADKFRLFLGIKGGTAAPLLTVQDFDSNEKMESEFIHAVGEVDAIGLQSTARTRDGKLSIEAGELTALLDLNGLANSTDIQDAVLAITSKDGVFNEVRTGVNIITKAFSVKAKDKHTPISLDWQSLT